MKGPHPMSDSNKTPQKIDPKELESVTGGQMGQIDVGGGGGGGGDWRSDGGGGGGDQRNGGGSDIQRGGGSDPNAPQHG